MKTWTHLLSSLILAVILYPVFSWKVLFILIGGVLIDIDHYFWYVYKYKKLNLFDCYKHYIIDEKNNFKNSIGILLIFHTTEFLLVMIVLSFYIEFVLIFTIGLLLHYLLDLIFLYYVPKRFIVNHSILWGLLKTKFKKFK